MAPLSTTIRGHPAHRCWRPRKFRVTPIPCPMCSCSLRLSSGWPRWGSPFPSACGFTGVMAQWRRTIYCSSWNKRIHGTPEDLKNAAQEDVPLPPKHPAGQLRPYLQKNRNRIDRAGKSSFTLEATGQKEPVFFNERWEEARPQTTPSEKAKGG